MDLQTLINRMTPFDCHTKEQFLDLLEEFPELKTSLELLLKSNKKWTRKAEKGEVKFVINDNRWKVSKVYREPPHVVLNVIRTVPVVSLNV